jgi:steroid delta-isomerase-like uncharacterized protein
MDRNIYGNHDSDDRREDDHRRHWPVSRRHRNDDDYAQQRLLCNNLRVSRHRQYGRADQLLGGARAEAIGEMSEKLKAAVREFYDRGWNRRDSSVIDELFSPEYEDHDAVAHTAASGRDAARRFIETFRAAIPDLHVEIEDQYAEGSTVITRWRATGTHEGTLLGVTATHRPLEVGGISIDDFDEEGRFVEGWGNWDGTSLLRQIGALPTASR